MGTVEWVLIAVAGLVAGLGIGFWLGRLGPKGAGARVAEAEAELENYKGKVTEHFAQSAAHFQAIGRQYRELYEHMAEGSERLCKTDASEDALSFPRPGDVAALTAEPEQAAPADEQGTESKEPAAREAVEADSLDDDGGTEQTQPDKQASAEAAEESVQASDAEPGPDKRLYH